MTWQPSNPAKSHSTERGVSDILGFAVVFGIVVISISLLYTVGTTALTDIQHAHAMDNAERAFDIVDANVEDLYRNDAPGRATELQFAGGQLAVSGTTTVSVTNVTNIEGRPMAVVAVSTPLSYKSKEMALYHAGGAVIRKDRENAIIVNDPPFRFSEDRVVLSLIETSSTGDSRSIGGTGSIHLSLRNRGSTIERIIDEPVTIEVSVTSPRYSAWERYFKNRADNCQSASVESNANTDTVMFECTTDAVHVRRTEISIRLTP